MAEATNTRKVIYEAMRQSRGGEPPEEISTWKRKAMIGGGSVLAVAMAVGGYFIWEALTYVTTTRASVCAAVLTLSGESDARVTEVLVRPGQTVARGQALMRLDDTEARAMLAAAEAARATAEAHVASGQADLELRLARLPDEIRRAEADRHEADARLAQLRKGATAEEIEAAKVRLASARALAELYAGDVEQTEQLVKLGYESRHDLEVQKTRLITQRNSMREAELELARLTIGATPEMIRAAEQTLAAREAALALARSGAKEVESMKAALAARKADLARAEAEVARTRAAMERTTIVSPVAGTVIRTFYHEGEICRRGTAALLVADDSAGRWFEGFVREQDARALKPEQRARVEMVVGSGEYVDATVEDVALATSSLGRNEADPQSTGKSIVTSELVWVKLRPVNLKGKPLPGMSARATIRVR